MYWLSTTTDNQCLHDYGIFYFVFVPTKHKLNCDVTNHHGKDEIG